MKQFDKTGYPDSLLVIAEKLRPGGVLIIDNALWGRRIFVEGDETASTQGVRELTRRLVTDAGWILSLLPVRDGLLVALKEQPSQHPSRQEWQDGLDRVER